MDRQIAVPEHYTTSSEKSRGSQQTPNDTATLALVFAFKPK
jgi:hypothetical protein